MFNGANVTVIVSDMKRALSFYVDILGLTLKASYGDQFAEVQAPGVVIALHPPVKGAPPYGGSDSLSIGLGVENLERAMKSLTAKGVIFQSTADDGPVRLAFFSDPDGNPLYLSQTRKWG